MFIGAVNYACHTQPYTYNNVAPFDLVLRKILTSVSFQARSSVVEDQCSPSFYIQKCRTWLKILMSTAGYEM